MLVFTRRPQQTIIVGTGPDRVTITVTEVRGDQVNIGIDAPREVLVLRGELCEEEEENDG